MENCPRTVGLVMKACTIISVAAMVLGCGPGGGRGGSRGSSGHDAYHHGDVAEHGDEDAYVPPFGDVIEDWLDTDELDAGSGPGEPLCEFGGTYNGSWSIKKDDDVQRIEPCQVITGDLEISYCSLENITLNNLREVGGLLRVRNNASLKRVTLNGLKKVGHAFHFTDNPAVDWMNYSALTEIGNNLTVRNNDALASVEMTYLETVGRSIEVEGNAVISAIYIKATQVEHSVEVKQNPKLTKIIMESIQEIGHELKVHHNVELIQLFLPYLKCVGAKVDIGHNDAYPACLVDSLYDAVKDCASKPTLYNQGNDGACP